MQVKSEIVKRVWRVEDEDGFGPYSLCGLDIEQVIGYHNQTNGHPGPCYDKGILRNMEQNELCGFLNLKQVYNWFTKEELKHLEEEGFRLKRVMAKRITAFGEKQILFERR